MNVHIPISVGELIDKFSILEIKKDRIKDPDKLNLINIELDLLMKERNKLEKFPEELYLELKQINENLWQIEDDIREKEAKIEFDQEFIELARSIYFTNDQRGELKKKINEFFNCEIQEVKEYKKYDNNTL